MRKVVRLTIVATVALAIGTIAFAALPQPVREVSWETTSNLLARGVTVKQFFEEVDPGMLSKIPSKFYDVEIKPATQSIRASRVGAESSRDLLPNQIAVACTGKIQPKSGSQCYFGVSNTVSWPPFYKLPYMSVIGLLYGPGGIWGSCSDSGTNVWRVTENDTIPVQGGESYALTGIHFIEYPSGYFPSTDVRYTQTSWITVP